MKNLIKITEPYTMNEASEIVKNIKDADVINTSDECYLVQKITEKTLKCTTSVGRKVILKSKLQDMIEEGIAEIN
jgi:hypothetical protein